MRLPPLPFSVFLVAGSILFLHTALPFGGEESATLEEGFAAIFDGESLEGWDGDPDWFRVTDGAIVAGSLQKDVPQNMFLSTEQEYGDFELRLRVRLLGDLELANAGIQIRSRRVPNQHEMIGYQADMGQVYWGCLYDESRRRKVLAGPDQEELAKVLRRGGWNDYVIRCQGKRIQLWLNGFQTVDYLEPDDDIEQIGLIGLQVHAGKASEAWYKDIRIKSIGSSGPSTGR